MSRVSCGGPSLPVGRLADNTLAESRHFGAHAGVHAGRHRLRNPRAREHHCRDLEGGELCTNAPARCRKARVITKRVRCRIVVETGAGGSRSSMNTLGKFVFALLCLALSGCGSHGSTSSGGLTGFTIDLTGTWLGTWTRSDGTSDVFTGIFDQSEPVQGGGSPTSLSGSASLVGFSCSTSMIVDASIYPGGFVGPSSFIGTLTDGSVTIQVFAIVTGLGNGIGGTYEVLAGSSCAGETGKLTATRVGPLQGSEPDPSFRTQIWIMYDEDGQIEFTRTIRQLVPHGD